MPAQPHSMVLDPATVHRSVLANGLTVLIRRDRSAPVVAIVTHVKAGYFDESDDVVGLAHVLEHMYFKGTPTRGPGEIARQTKAVGGYLNAGTIYDRTSYYAVLPASGFVAGLDVQFDAYANSLVDAGELAREIEVIVEEAKRKADNPGAVTTETLYELLHDQHRMRRWRIGREAGLRALTQRDVVEFYRNHYRPSNTILVIAGDVELDAALREVEARYGQLPAGDPVRDAGPAEVALPGFRYRELEGDIAQAQFAFGWRTPGSLDADTARLELLATVLGSGRASRLYRAVRERSLVQGITAYDYTPTELGVFVVHAELRPEAAPEALRATWSQLLEARTTAPSDQELERAKRLHESRWLRRLETMEGQANHLAEWEALGGWQLGDAYFEQLLSTTAAQVAAAAERWLSPDQASLVVYRPRTAPAVARDAGAARALLGAGGRTPPAGGRTPPAGGRIPAFERAEHGVRVYRTASRVPVLVRRKPGAAIAHLGAYFLGGATAEAPGGAGLTAMLARLAVKGTASRSAARVAEEGEMLGGSVGGGAGNDSFGWSISVPTARIGAAAELLADVVQRPSIPDDVLATERAIAIADVISLRDDMSRYPVRLATSAAYSSHPYGTPVSGTEASLARIDAPAVRRWHAERVLAGSPVIAVVGDVEPDDAASTIASCFAALAAGSSDAAADAAWSNAGAVAAESRDKKQTALTMLFPGPRRSDGDRFAATMLVAIASGLGGRFFDSLRDRQSLCYTVQAFHTDRRLAGTFGTYIATSPEKEDAAREGLFRELRRFREELVTADELARAQAYALGTHAIRQQSGGAVLAGIVDAWMFGDLSELGTYESAIRAVTRADVQRVAVQYLERAMVVEGVVRGTSLPE